MEGVHLRVLHQPHQQGSSKEATSYRGANRSVVNAESLQVVNELLVLEQVRALEREERVLSLLPVRPGTQREDSKSSLMARLEPWEVDRLRDELEMRAAGTLGARREVRDEEEKAGEDEGGDEELSLGAALRNLDVDAEKEKEKEKEIEKEEWSDTSRPAPMTNPMDSGSSVTLFAGTEKHTQIQETLRDSTRTSTTMSVTVKTLPIPPSIHGTESGTTNLTSKGFSPLRVQRITPPPPTLTSPRWKIREIVRRATFCPCVYSGSQEVCLIFRFGFEILSFIDASFIRSIEGLSANVVQMVVLASPAALYLPLRILQCPRPLLPEIQNTP